MPAACSHTCSAASSGASTAASTCVNTGHSLELVCTARSPAKPSAQLTWAALRVCWPLICRREWHLQGGEGVYALGRACWLVNTCTQPTGSVSASTERSRRGKRRSPLVQRQGCSGGACACRRACGRAECEKGTSEDRAEHALVSERESCAIVCAAERPFTAAVMVRLHTKVRWLLFSPALQAPSAKQSDFGTGGRRGPGVPGRAACGHQCGGRCSPSDLDQQPGQRLRSCVPGRPGAVPVP